MGWLIRGVFLVGLLVGAAPMAGVTWAAGTTQPDVTVKDGKVSISSKGATLGDILRAMEKKAGLVLKASPKLEDPVTNDFFASSVDEVVSQLLVDYNYALSQQKKKTSVGQHTQNYLLWVYEKKSGSAKVVTPAKVAGTPGRAPTPAPAPPTPPSGGGMQMMEREKFVNDFGNSDVIARQVAAQPPGDTPAGQNGILVHSIQADSTLAQLGIATGDVISDVNGSPVRSVQDLAKALSPEAVGDKTIVKIERIRADKAIAPIYINIKNKE